MSPLLNARVLQAASDVPRKSDDDFLVRAIERLWRSPEGEEMWLQAYMIRLLGRTPEYRVSMTREGAVCRIQLELTAGPLPVFRTRGEMHGPLD